MQVPTHTSPCHVASQHILIKCLLHAHSLAGGSRWGEEDVWGQGMALTFCARKCQVGSGGLSVAAAGSVRALGTTEETVLKCMCLSCFHPIPMGSAFKPHGNTELCTLIITLAQPAKDGILTWLEAK